MPAGTVPSQFVTSVAHSMIADDNISAGSQSATATHRRQEAAPAKSYDTLLQVTAVSGFQRRSSGLHNRVQMHTADQDLPWPV